MSMKKANLSFLVNVNENVLKALEHAIKRVGEKEFLNKIPTSKKQLEEWQEKLLIPINVVAAACEINRENENLPNEVRFVHSCIENTEIHKKHFQKKPIKT